MTADDVSVEPFLVSAAGLPGRALPYWMPMMDGIRRVLTILTVAASVAMSQDVKALVHDLSGPTGVAWRKASQLLQEMPPETVTAEIARALKEDREFTVISARFGVYEFISDLVKERREQKRTIERPYLEQLKAGLAESNPGLRRIAIDSLACVEPALQKEVAAWITPVLEDASLENVAAVADALRRFESRAADSASVKVVAA